MLFYENLQDYISSERKRLDVIRDANIPEVGVILAVFGPADNQDKRTNVSGYSVTQEVDFLELDYQGIVGDRHRRLTRKSTGREKALYPSASKVQIREQRHIFGISSFDCEVLSDKIGAKITPQLLGANILIGGVDGKAFSLTDLPAHTYFVIADADAEDMPKPPLATLIYYAEQQGCGITGNALVAHYGDVSYGRKFIEHSKHNRGVVLTAEYPVDHTVKLCKGQKIFFKFPKHIAP